MSAFRALFLIGWLAGIGGACDTTVIAVGSGGGGAAPSTTEVGTTPGSGGSGPCGTPHPVLPLTPGSGSVSAGTGLPMECEWGVDDQAGHTWLAHCTVNGCSCRFDGAEVCSCINDPPTATCDSINNCCPSGWPKL